jgi:hypothetical protein
MPFRPLHWWAVCSLAAGACRVLVSGFARRLRGLLERGALSFLLVSRFCAAVVDFRFVSVRVAFGGLAFSGLCCVWSFLFVVPVGLCSCVAFAASAAFCVGLCCGVGSVTCVCLSVSCLLSSPFLHFSFASLCQTDAAQPEHPLTNEVGIIRKVRWIQKVSSAQQAAQKAVCRCLQRLCACAGAACMRSAVMYAKSSGLSAACEGHTWQCGFCILRLAGRGYRHACSVEEILADRIGSSTGLSAESRKQPQRCVGAGAHDWGTRPCRIAGRRGFEWAPKGTRVLAVFMRCLTRLAVHLVGLHH